MTTIIGSVHKVVGRSSVSFTTNSISFTTNSSTGIIVDALAKTTRRIVGKDPCQGDLSQLDIKSIIIVQKV